jgi:hypothetical protein
MTSLTHSFSGFVGFCSIRCCKTYCEIWGSHNMKMEITVMPCSSVGASSVSQETAIFMSRVPWRWRQRVPLKLSYPLSYTASGTWRPIHNLDMEISSVTARLGNITTVLHTQRIMAGPAKFMSAVWPVTRLSEVFTELTASWEAVQLLKKFTAVYGTQRFITVFTGALHWSLS